MDTTHRRRTTSTTSGTVGCTASRAAAAAALVLLGAACSQEPPPTDGAPRGSTAPPSTTSSAPASQEQGAWPPTRGTDGAWLPLPPDQLSPVETVDACGSSVTTRYLDGVDTEYQAEVTDTATTVRYRSSVAVTEVLRADGARVELDNTGPATEVYEDPDADGDVDVYRVEGTGPSLLTNALPEQAAAARAAGVPALAHWTEGTVTVTFAFPADPGSAVPPEITVATTSTSLEDVCALLDAAAT